LNDHFNIQNAGVRYSQENLQGGGNEMIGLNDYQLHKPILSSHQFDPTGFAGSKSGSSSLEQI